MICVAADHQGEHDMHMVPAKQVEVTVDPVLPKHQDRGRWGPFHHFTHILGGSGPSGVRSHTIWTHQMITAPRLGDRDDNSSTVVPPQCRTRRVHSCFRREKKLSEGSPFRIHQWTFQSIRPVDGRWKSERSPNVGFDQRWRSSEESVRRQRMQRWKTGFQRGGRTVWDGQRWDLLLVFQRRAMSQGYACLDCVNLEEVFQVQTHDAGWKNVWHNSTVGRSYWWMGSRRLQGRGVAPRTTSNAELRRFSICPGWGVVTTTACVGVTRHQEDSDRRGTKAQQAHILDGSSNRRFGTGSHSTSSWKIWRQPRKGVLEAL